MTYEFYRDIFYGELIPEESFAKYANRTEDDLKLLTRGKTLDSDDYKKALCALAEINYEADRAKSQGVIKSVSAGGESVSYEPTGAAAVINDSKAMLKLKFEAVRPYLWQTGLLYWGC